jgi:hypothetical protein
MEKLSKLTNNSLSLSDFNFKGYRRSKNWIGYCEGEKGSHVEKIDEAISLFSDFFKDKSDNVITMTALAFYDRAEYDRDVIKKYGRLYTKFKKMGILQPLTDKFGSYLFGDCRLSASALRFDFDFGFKNMIDLSKLIMAHGSVRGEVCFFIFKDLNLSVYPHQDQGFGCIGLNGDKRAGIEFLEFCKKSQNFKVVIEESVT